MRFTYLVAVAGFLVNILTVQFTCAVALVHSKLNSKTLHILTILINLHLYPKRSGFDLSDCFFVSNLPATKENLQL